LYDTATAAVRDFQPVHPGKVGIYHCGLTVQGAQYGPPPGPQNGRQQYGPPQGPPMGPGFGFGSNGFPPPKKKSKAGFVVVPLVLLAFVGVGLFTLSTVLKHNGDSDYTQPQPTYTATEEPTGAPTSIATTAKRPTAPATSKSTQPKPTKTTTTAPEPTDLDVVTKNRLYKTGVQASVKCRESSARPSNGTNAGKYYAQILACLNRAWPKQVALAGGRFVPPRLVVFAGSTSSPCSGNAPSSFYCRTNRTIYMDAGGDMELYQKYRRDSYAMAWVRAEMTDTVAHEFGHHIQAMTGILSASSNLEYEFSGDKALEMSRRTEIQATCLGSVFMGANRSSYGITGAFKKQLDYLHSHQGDEYGTQRDHGSRAIIPQWANAGFSTRSPRACNTWTASPRYVR
jgi:predicted metalloprotease